jgi:predicted nucleic acid-binding Zn ribbon protein
MKNLKYSELMAKIPLERNQFRLGDAIQKFLKESGLDEKLQQHRVASYWDAVLEGKIAAATKYIKVKDGVVSVGLESSVARQELHMRKTEIIAALNAKMGSAYVKEIRVH